MNIMIHKRDGRIEPYDKNRIQKVIISAMAEAGIQDITKAEELTTSVHDYLIECMQTTGSKEVTVEFIQDVVVRILSEAGYTEIARRYEEYRKERSKIRQQKTDLINVINKISEHTDRDNANVGNNFSAKLLRMASEVNKVAIPAKMPKDIAKNHENGDIYYHDFDSFDLTVNCLHIPVKKLLMNGFNPGYGFVSGAKRFSSAASIACIILQSSQNDLFGGQSFANIDNDLGLWVDLSRMEILSEKTRDFEEINGRKPNMDEFARLKTIVEERLDKELEQGVQNILYNLNTMHSRAGAQVPFSSINIGLPENDDEAKITEKILLGYEKGMGKGEQFIFPNICYRMKKGVNKKGDKYYYLTKIAFRVAGKRANPTFMNMDAKNNMILWNQGIKAAVMGCRTYIGGNVNGDQGPEARGNNAPHTINLPRLAIKAKLNNDGSVVDTFLGLLGETLVKTRESLLYRYEVLKKLKVKDIPFSVGQGLMKGSEGLTSGDSIEPILKNGTWGIGFVGLAETLTALVGYHHGESEEVAKLGLDIIKFMRVFCDESTQTYKLNFTLYATPAESVAYKLLEMDKAKFGIIKGITDKEYYTNSYHIPVSFEIGIRQKLDIEAPYHQLCNAGHISYVEFDDYPDADTVAHVIEYAFENEDMDYLGVNFHTRYCKDCGRILRSFESKCPNDGSVNIQGVSRVTGYLSLDERFGPGKVAERRDRISHVNFKKAYNVQS